MKYNLPMRFRTISSILLSFCSGSVPRSEDIVTGRGPRGGGPVWIPASEIDFRYIPGYYSMKLGNQSMYIIPILQKAKLSGLRYRS